MTGPEKRRSLLDVEHSLVPEAAEGHGHAVVLELRIPCVLPFKLKALSVDGRGDAIRLDETGKIQAIDLGAQRKQGWLVP
jgi:hypothetical protein